MRPQVTMQMDVRATEGGSSQVVAATTTSAQSAVIGAQATGVPVFAIVTATAPVFMRAGANPTALSTGVDHYLAANIPYRVEVQGGQRLAFITPTGTASVYITPDL